MCPAEYENIQTVDFISTYKEFKKFVKYNFPSKSHTFQELNHASEALTLAS